MLLRPASPMAGESRNPGRLAFQEALAGARSGAPGGLIRLAGQASAGIPVVSVSVPERMTLPGRFPDGVPSTTEQVPFT